MIFLNLLLLACVKTHTMLDAIQDNDMKKLKEQIATNPPVQRLDEAISYAVSQKHIKATKALLKAGAYPPLFSAAKAGNTPIVEKIVQETLRRRIQYSATKKERLIKRLILTGNTLNLELYFQYGILYRRDITQTSIDYARTRADLHKPNERIWEYLTTHYIAPSREAKRKRSRDDTPTEEKKLKFDQTECLICFDDFKEKKAEELLCGHAFHAECAAGWFASRGFKQCPTCKEPKSSFDTKVPEHWMTWIHAHPGEEAPSIETQRRMLAEFNRQREERAAAAAEGPSD